MGGRGHGRAWPHRLCILPLRRALGGCSSGGPSGEGASACARRCCSRLYSRSSASSVPAGAATGTGTGTAPGRHGHTQPPGSAAHPPAHPYPPLQVVLAPLCPQGGGSDDDITVKSR